MPVADQLVTSSGSSATHLPIVAEVRRAARERARVGVGVEHREALVERVGDGAAGRELHDEVGRLAHAVDRLLEEGAVEGRLVLAVAHVDVDERRAGLLAGDRRLDELLGCRRQGRDVGLGGLGARRGDGDQGARGGACGAHAAHPASARGRLGQGATIVVWAAESPSTSRSSVGSVLRLITASAIGPSTWWRPTEVR